MIGQSAPTSDVARFAQEIATLSRRLRELELASATGKGWVPIESGSVSAETTFTITVPSGVYSSLRLSINMLTAGAASIATRINSDTTANLHARSNTVEQPNGTVDSSQDGTLGTSYVVAVTDGSAVSSVATFFGTDETGRVRMLATGMRQGSPTSSKFFRGSGWLTANRLVSSLQVFADTAMTGRWTLEGYRS